MAANRDGISNSSSVFLSQCRPNGRALARSSQRCAIITDYSVQRGNSIIQHRVVERLDPNSVP